MAMILLGEFLLEKKFITKQQLEEALQTQRVFSGSKLGEILVDRGILSRAELEQALEMQNTLRGQAQEVAPTEKAGLLSQIHLLKELTGEELQSLTAVCRVEAFERGHFIYVEGEEGNAVYFLASGAVRLLKSGPRGGEEELGVVGTGEIFGDADFLARTTRSHTASAQLTSTALVLTREKYEELQRGDCSLGAKLTNIIAQSLALRLQQAEARLIELAGQTRISQGFL
jgi:CRP-like cAMP-binding protein